MATSDMPQPAFVFDFDGVIADTARLKGMIFANVEREGFLRSDIETAYEQVKRERGGQDPAEFARRLSNGSGETQQRISQAWRQGERRITEVVSTKMFDLVNTLRTSGYPTILLTAGRIEVQQRKVHDAGLDDTVGGPFREIIYVEEDEKGENKIVELRGLLAKHHFLMIFDDQAYNIEPFASRFPRDQVLPVFVRLFPDKRNATYVPPAGVPTLSSTDQLTIETIHSFLPQS